MPNAPSLDRPSDAPRFYRIIHDITRREAFYGIVESLQRRWERMVGVGKGTAFMRHLVVLANILLKEERSWQPERP